jgi:hypothetical protein
LHMPFRTLALKAPFLADGDPRRLHHHRPRSGWSAKRIRTPDDRDRPAHRLSDTRALPPLCRETRF